MYDIVRRGIVLFKNKRIARWRKSLKRMIFRRFQGTPSFPVLSPAIVPSCCTTPNKTSDTEMPEPGEYSRRST